MSGVSQNATTVDIAWKSKASEKASTVLLKYLVLTAMTEFSKKTVYSGKSRMAFVSVAIAPPYRWQWLSKNSA